MVIPIYLAFILNDLHLVKVLLHNRITAGEMVLYC